MIGPKYQPAPALAARGARKIGSLPPDKGEVESGRVSARRPVAWCGWRRVEELPAAAGSAYVCRVVWVCETSLA